MTDTAISTTETAAQRIRWGAPLGALGLAAALALGGAVLPAGAQTSEAPLAPAPSTDFTEAQLEAFVAAALRVADVRDQYTAELAEIEDEEAQQALIAEGNAEMLAAVEDADGITVEEYITIGEAAAADPELGQRIAMMVEAGMADE